MTRKNPIVPAGGGAERRLFLKAAALAVAGIGLNANPWLSGRAFAAIQRPHAATRFALELDGQVVDLVKSIEGGYPYAEVVRQTLGNQRVPTKVAGQVRYSEIAVQLGVTPNALLRWIAASFDGAPGTKNGAIVGYDQNYAEMVRLNFFGALPTQLILPACDAAANEMGYLTARLLPERSEIPAGGGPGRTAPAASRTERPWRASNFQLRIAGLEQACTGVVKIEPLPIVQKVAAEQTGDFRQPANTATTVEYPNLVIHVAENKADDFFAWFDDFLIRGNRTSAREKSGSLDLLAPNQRDVMLRINFSGLGIIGCRPEFKGDRATVRVEMYCQRIALDLGAPAGGKAGDAKTEGRPAGGTQPGRREAGGGSGSVGLDVIRGFKQ